MKIEQCLVVFLLFVGLCAAQGTSKTVPPSSTPSGPPPSSTTVEQKCQSASKKGCSTCLKHAECLYCIDQDLCVKYPVGNILPMKTCNGGLDKTRWGVCWVNFKILLIVMGVLAAVILLTLGCCIYCCCCRSGGNKKKYQAEEAKWTRQKEERTAKSEERRADRKEKHDEIRRKYGLIKEDNPYQRFDA